MTEFGMFSIHDDINFYPHRCRSLRCPRQMDYLADLGPLLSRAMGEMIYGAVSDHAWPKISCTDGFKKLLLYS